MLTCIATAVAIQSDYQPTEANLATRLDQINTLFVSKLSPSILEGFLKFCNLCF